MSVHRGMNFGAAKAFYGKLPAEGGFRAGQGFNIQTAIANSLDPSRVSNDMRSGDEIAAARAAAVVRSEVVAQASAARAAAAAGGLSTGWPNWATWALLGGGAFLLLGGGAYLYKRRRSRPR